MKTRLIQIIIKDRARAIPIAVTSASWLIFEVARYFGLELTLTQQNTIAVAIGVALGWFMDAWALENSVSNTKDMQTDLKRFDPTIEVDGYAGPEMASTVKEITSDI